MGSMAGKSFIITGAGGGIGRETALELGRLGARVTVADLKEDLAQSTAREIVASGGKAIGDRNSDDGR